ncbi:hypothetical protein B4099_2029 [Heyndrickxia coagulans]|uniref:Uncharacterized protein n=1 Tax=Heyndrickxia coagulans TaxID=1398 RepID=A0A150KHD2_HEYCO|nr:hypothetical protein B4099_2029 [Heyndrickxia coagulans]
MACGFFEFLWTDGNIQHLRGSITLVCLDAHVFCPIAGKTGGNRPGISLRFFPVSR